MLTMTDVENIILGMAELVQENRYLRKENERLSEELAVTEGRLNKMYEANEQSASNMLYGMLAMSYKDDGDMEKARCYADKINT